MQTNKNLDIVLVDVNKIIPYWRNPRRNDKTVEWLCEIIPAYGFNVPIVLDKQNVVVKGHARLRAAKRLGMLQVPCIYSENDDETNKADRIADNKIQEMSLWDFARLELEFQKIGDLKFDRLFHPEEMTHLDYQPDPSIAFQGTSLDDYGNFMNEDDAQPIYEFDGANGNAGSHSAGLEEYAEGEGEGGSSENPSESGSGTYESQLQKGQRALKTLCPYCGATVYIRL